MATRVSPTDRIRAEIDALFAAEGDLGEVVEDVARLGARLILQTAPEVEVTEVLGRERYERDDRAGAGSRNGHSDVTVKTTAGPVTLEYPGCAAPTRRSPPACWASTSPAPTR